MADISYIRLGRRFIYLAVILDALTRSVRGWALSRSLEQQLTLDALDMALAKAIPFIFHSDQGPPYAPGSTRIACWVWGAKSACRTKPVRPRTAWWNASCVVKDEHGDYSDYHDFEDAYQQLKHFLGGRLCD